MSLRFRVVLITLAIAAPVFAVLVYVAQILLERENSTMLSSFISAQMHEDRDECEASPATWSGRMFPGPPRGRDDDRGPMGPGPDERPRMKKKGKGPGHKRPPETRLFAYDASFQSSNPEAPALDADFTAELQDHDRVTRVIDRENGKQSQLLLRMSWTEGPCAYILAVQPGRFNGPRGRLPPLEPLFVVMGVMLAAIVVAVEPIVRRIRRLEREVRRAASDAYATPVSVSGKDEISQLARAFDDAGREVRSQIALVEQRERTLREFLENTTHDVNTPLTVLLGHLRALAEKNDPAVVASALREGHYMASLLHNLAVAAKLEAAEPELRQDRVDVGALVERSVSRHRPIADQLGVALDHAVPEEKVFVLGDVTMIEQAVSNFVHNAVRYNQRGGHVAVVLEVASNSFSVRVLDDGPGIPEEERARIFERHVRGNTARTRQSEGQGLGLNIAARVSRLHGFDLSIAQSEMGGTEIVLSGPIVSSTPNRAD